MTGTQVKKKYITKYSTLRTVNAVVTKMIVVVYHWFLRICIKSELCAGMCIPTLSCRCLIKFVLLVESDRIIERCSPVYSEKDMLTSIGPILQNIS